MPWESMQDVPANIKALAAIPGGKNKILLTLAQANEIGRMYDGVKGKEGIDNPMAIAITNFRRMYQVQNGSWVKRKKEKASEIGSPKTIIVSYQDTNYIFRGEKT